MGKHRRKQVTTSSSSSSESEDEDVRRTKRHRSSRKSDKRREKDRRKNHKYRSERAKRKKRDYSSESEESSPSPKKDRNTSREEPEGVLKCILEEFPAVASDLVQLLQMIDDGQAVDIKGLSQKSLVRHLRKLFISLKLKEKGDNCFLLPSHARPTMEILGGIIQPTSHSEKQHLESGDGACSGSPDSGGREATNVSKSCENAADTRRRIIGPAMPSAELLAAAARLTEAHAELREVELEADSGVFIGPPPPELVVEAESSNEAERFEEITRIMGADADSPYDVLGVNSNMSVENMKKRYWKLSLMVHPDKCSHPQAQQSFVKLNKAYKELQDPDKKKALDEIIKAKEEKEAFKAELKAMKEAAHWRRLQGISMEGDDILLAEMDGHDQPKRDEWMTKLPPERQHGASVSMQSTRFNKSTKEGRGDTSAWTDTPSDRAQKAKTNYLEAYNEATALASNEQDGKRMTAEAEMVEQYNKAKRSKSLIEKHREKSSSSSSTAQNRGSKKKKKSRHEDDESAKKKEEEEWEGKHPWKPWDREKDLTAGRLSVKLDTDDMAQGLNSRFSSGSFQKSFL